MRARVRAPGAPEQGALADFLRDPASEGKLKGVRRAKAQSDLDAAVERATHRVKSGDWEESDGRLLVGLYAWCHRATYGFVPPELEEKAEFRAAARAALRILHDVFEDDGARAAVFMRWAWKREKERAAWRQREGIEQTRMGWRLQFSTRMVGDFRVASGAGRK